MDSLGQLAVLAVIGIVVLQVLGFNPVAILGNGLQVAYDATLSFLVDIGNGFYEWVVGGLADSFAFW